MPINEKVILLRAKLRKLEEEQSRHKGNLAYLNQSLGWVEATGRVDEEIKTEKEEQQKISDQIQEIKLEIRTETEKEEQREMLEISSKKEKEEYKGISNQILKISPEIVQKRDALKPIVNTCRIEISRAMNPKNKPKGISLSNNLAAKSKIANSIRDFILSHEKAIPSEYEAITTLKNLAKEIHDYNKTKNPRFHRGDPLDHKIDEMLGQTKKFLQTTVPHGEATYNLAEYIIQATDKGAQTKDTSAENKSSFFRWGSKTTKDDQSTKVATNQTTKLPYAKKILDYLHDPGSLKKEGTDLETVLLKAINENKKANDPDRLDGIFQKLLTDVQAEKAVLSEPSIPRHRGLS